MNKQDYKNTTLYLQSAAYAREHGELEAYRASYRANIACKEAIEAAIHDNYHDNRMNSKATSAQVGEKFSVERIAYVLAATIQNKDWDGRFSRGNKAWAKTIPVCKDLDAQHHDRNVYFVIDQAHSGLVDLFTSHIRKELALRTPTVQEKPSILKKIKETPCTYHTADASKKKGEPER